MPFGGGVHGFSQADQKRTLAIAAACADMLTHVGKGAGSGHGGTGANQWTWGTSNGQQHRKGAGKAWGKPGRGSDWRCNECGEPANYANRQSCYKCHAPRGKGGGKGGCKTTAGPAAARGIYEPADGQLRPKYGRREEGPIGADGSRPLLRAFVQGQARDRAQAATTAGATKPSTAEQGTDDDGFTVVARAAGIWPRVGGNDGSSNAKGQQSGGKPAETAQQPGARNSTAGPPAAAKAVPPRPPWADSCPADDDDGELVDADGDYMALAGD